MLIGLFLKHIKAYKGIKYIPMGSKYNFVSYIGENGVGKSSILEAIDSYFNTIVNKSGNTSFHRNFKNLEVENYFKENSGDNKVTFAEKYIALMIEAENADMHIPSWVNTIKQFFNKQPMISSL